MSLDFDPDDLPGGYPDMWSPLVGTISPQLAYYRANRDALNQQRRQTRPSRAKEPSPGARTVGEYIEQRARRVDEFARAVLAKHGVGP